MLNFSFFFLPWPHPGEPLKAQILQKVENPVKSALRKSLALGIMQGWEYMAMRKLFPLCSLGTALQGIQLLCTVVQQWTDGCVGLCCFKLLWVKLSPVETKAISSHQTAVPHLTLDLCGDELSKSPAARLSPWLDCPLMSFTHKWTAESGVN